MKSFGSMRSAGLVKKLLLAAASLGMALVAFAFYSRQFVEVKPFEPPPKVTTRPASGLAETRPAGARVSGLGMGGDVVISGGEKPKHQYYDEFGRLKVEFQAQRWEPVAEDEWHLTEPKLWQFDPKGKVTRITADEGQVVVQQTSSGSMTAKRGWLRGNVHVLRDETTTAWRDAHPDRRASEQHSEAVVEFWLDEVQFNFDLSQLTSDGTIKIVSERFEMHGRGLKLNWNQRDNRIELLEILQGDRLILRDVDDFSMMAGKQPEAGVSEPIEAMASDDQPTTQPIGSEDQAVAAAAAPTTQPAATNRPLAEATDQQAPTSAPADTAKAIQVAARPESEQPKRIQTYHATFEGGVTAVQRGPEGVVGKLEAERLTLLVDLTDTLRSTTGDDLSREKKATTQTEPGDPNAPSAAQGEAQPEGEATGKTVVEVMWKGRLVVESDAPRTAGPDDRIELVAVGEPVVGDAGENRIVCGTLEYHHQDGQVWLRRTAKGLAEISGGTKGRVAGETIFLDRRGKLGRISGAGTMVQSGQGEPEYLVMLPSHAEIRWTEGVEMTFAEADVQRGAGLATMPYVQDVQFRGDVRMTREDMAVAADAVSVVFGPPRREANDTAERIVAQGHVALAQGANRISCDAMEVDLTADGDGQPMPERMRARGQVAARQGDRAIHADEILATFEQMVDPNAPLLPPVPDPLKWGIDSGSDDTWMAPLPAAQEQRGTVDIKSLQARGDVTVYDPDPSRRLLVRGDGLECEFSAGRQIKTATITGEPEAQAAYQDYELFGPVIELDMDRLQAEVNKPGRLRFEAKQDIDGRPLAKSVAVTVHWSDRMLLWGADNVAWFYGDVRSVRDNSVVTCDTLRLDFQDLPPDAIAQSPDVTDRLWLLGKAIKAVRGESATGEDQASLSRRVRKRPAYIEAEGDVVAVWYKLDASGQRRINGMQLAGPEMVVDLIRNQLDVLGAGSLLIEDYRSPSAERRASGRSGSMMGDLASTGPSQTLITWVESMTLFSEPNMAVFFGDVDMTHRSGRKLVLADDMAKALNVDIDQVRYQAGRNAALKCRQLAVQFADSSDRGGDGPALSGWRATDFQRLEAAGDVFLVDGTRSLVANELIYDDVAQTVTVRGTTDKEARIIDVEEATGNLRGFYRGQVIRWNRTTNQIEVDQPRMMTVQ